MIIEYNTGKCDIALIKVLQGLDHFEIKNGKLETYERDAEIFNHYDSIELPEGNWSLLGNAFELTEEQAETILDHASDKWDKYYGWKDYEDLYHYHETYKESLYSLLRHLKVYKENPYGKEEPTDMPDLGAFTQARRQKWRLWKEAEKTTGSWIILIKTCEGANT